MSCSTSALTALTCSETNAFYWDLICKGHTRWLTRGVANGFYVDIAKSTAINGFSQREYHPSLHKDHRSVAATGLRTQQSLSCCDGHDHFPIYLASSTCPYQ